MDEIAEIVLKKIDELQKKRGCAVAAIDGRCAAGKTTLAALLQKQSGCAVIHMDHFFLQPQQRTKERMNEPGGNVDRERFEAEVLKKLRSGEPIVYRPFDCGAQKLSAPVTIPPAALYVVEGSYSCHPALRSYYDLCVFLSVESDEQLRRIAARGGESAVSRFRELWIPLEERYFSALKIADNCDIQFST